MTVHINESVEVNAPISLAWAYVDDYCNVPDWLYGINKFVPTGEIENGLGAVYDAEMMVGVPIKTRVEITAWEFEKRRSSTTPDSRKVAMTRRERTTEGTFGDGG